MMHSNLERLVVGNMTPVALPFQAKQLKTLRKLFANKTATFDDKWNATDQTL